MLAQADVGALQTFAYSSVRGYGDVHPTLGELRLGNLPVEVAHPLTGEPVAIGEILATECEMVSRVYAANGQHPEGNSPPKFGLGYGFSFGHNEVKVMSMSIITEMLADRMVAGQTNTGSDGSAMKHGWSREVGMLSLMDHSPGQGQYTTEKACREYMQRTRHKSDAEVDAILALKRSQASKIDERDERVARMARKAGLPIATHDADAVEKVEKWSVPGVTLSEFPTTIEATRRARELGLAVSMGAPNALRGKSSSGNLSALGAIRAGIADILCAEPGASAIGNP